MKIATSLILFLCISVVVCGVNSQNEAEPFLTRMFDYANAHNVSALEELRDKMDLKKDPNLAAAYSLALYIAAPEKYKQQYVDNFPADSEGMRYFNEQIELKGLTPSYFFIDAIGRIAEEGNDKAIEKVIIGFTLSDGGAAELFCDCLEKLYDKQLRKTIRTLARIEEGLRQKTYVCFRLMELGKFSSLKSKLRKMKPAATDAETKIIYEIENYR
jgi:hypothetical protein